MNSQKIVFEISWQTFFRTLFFGLLVFILIAARQTVGVFAIAVVLSLGFGPFVDFLERRKIPRILGTVAVFLVGLLVLAITIYLVAPVVVGEASGFIQHFNDTLTSTFGVGLSQKVVQALNLNLEKALSLLVAYDISVTGTASAVFEKLILVLATIAISFYLMVQKDGMEQLIKGILPYSYEKTALLVFGRFKAKIRRWLVSQLALGLVVGILVWLGLLVLGVKYSLIIGLLAFIFELIPIIGPIIIGFVAFIVAITESLSLGLYTVVFFILVQQFENHVLVPLVMGRALKVSPVIIIIALLAGTQFAGFVGLLLAIPLAVMAQELFNYLEERKGQRPVIDF